MKFFFTTKICKITFIGICLFTALSCGSSQNRENADKINVDNTKNQFENTTFDNATFE